MPTHLKGKVCKTMIRLMMMFLADAWTVMREEELLERTEMRMLRWRLGGSLKDKKTNKVIRKTLGVGCITGKI